MGCHLSAEYSRVVRKLRSARLHLLLVIDARTWVKNLGLCNKASSRLLAADPDGDLIFSVPPVLVDVIRIQRGQDSVGADPRADLSAAKPHQGGDRGRGRAADFTAQPASILRPANASDPYRVCKHVRALTHTRRYHG
jgi:hypothetical protein